MTFLVIISAALLAIYLLQKVVDKRSHAKPKQLNAPSQHAMIVTGYHVDVEGEAIYALEDRLFAHLDGNDLIEFDGHEIKGDRSEFKFYFYGPDAKNMFQEIQPILVSDPCMKDAQVYLRFGNFDDIDPVTIRTAVDQEPDWP